MNNTQESNYPERVFIKGCNLFDNHTRKPKATFSANMYVMVNPWIEAYEPEYIRLDLFEELEKKINELEQFKKEALEMAGFYGDHNPRQFPGGYYEINLKEGEGGHVRFGERARAFIAKHLTEGEGNE
jgi:hypothetical protein